MIKSMTGYGRGKYSNDSREYTVEIKTINHRYNEISIKMPRYLNFLEDELRKYISKSVARGKTDVYVTLENLDKSKQIKIDRNLLSMYIDEMRLLVDEYNIPNDISVTSIMKLPDIITFSNDENEDMYWDEIKKATDLALENILLSREKEGERLKIDIISRLEIIHKNILNIEDKSSGLIEEYKTKLENRIKELNASNVIDENRLGMEIVLFSDKSSICEEITRLKSHIISLRDILETVGPIGKKLDFLVQEMNREINTIGSKANSLNITNYVVDTKNEIENIREQIQNIE